MPEQQAPSKKLTPSELSSQGTSLRNLSRSPHPYRHQRAELPHATLKPRATFPASPSSHRLGKSANNGVFRDASKIVVRDVRPSQSTESDSGTEADDEHFLKGLPAPRWRPHKGLRGGDGSISGSPSPLVSPAILNEESGRASDYLKKGATAAKRVHGEDIWRAAEKFRRKRSIELGRRFTEIILLMAVGAIVLSRDDVLSEVRSWNTEISALICTTSSLIIIYPLRLVVRTAIYGSKRGWPFTIPSSFDPAPLLYPPVLTMFVALLLAVSNTAVILPSVILSVSSLPSQLIPVTFEPQGFNSVHWLLSCVPLFVSKQTKSSALAGGQPIHLEPEILVLLYPLHQVLCVTLHFLTTTSLLRAELQLLSISLIELLLLSSSPQSVILKALLWGGGMGILLACRHVLKWGVDLARVPKWRFRRQSSLGRPFRLSESKQAEGVHLLDKLKVLLGSANKIAEDSSDDEVASFPTALKRHPVLRVESRNLNTLPTEEDMEFASISAVDPKLDDKLFDGAATQESSSLKSTQRRHTLPNIGETVARASKRILSGRRKRSASSSLQGFFHLTESQATARKWIYAGYVYFCVICIVLMCIRPYIATNALCGYEPFGWALGYLLGNLPWFRMEVMTANLENWIRLPIRNPESALGSCESGWVEHLRYATFGAANVRLVLCAYWLAIIVVGLAIVFRLSAIYEVDTRRKVFHFMMVGMLLPATYIDPAFAALALIMVLGVFLLLDLFRASQLPPLSKPLAYFLTPYVDGRDLRGPVVISHIFLLIGSAIPLWLSLGALPRTGSDPWKGWDIPTRDVSMVSGVICVGMGDAAASLIGRRYGRHKWFWGGGKSVEGSLAFAAAVATALLFAKAWLRIGGWPSGNDDSWAYTLSKTGVAAGLASLTEAVLTGGNDNVVVPVVLWLCVKGLVI